MRIGSYVGVAQQENIIGSSGKFSEKALQNLFGPAVVRGGAAASAEDVELYASMYGPTGMLNGEKDADLPNQAASMEKDMNGKPLSSADQELLDRLKARDAKVRTHEHAHLSAAAGQAAGPASYTYQTGPDGKRYAIGGSVNISMSYNSGDPEESLRSARTAFAAAMATGEPSSKDMAAANKALSMAARARRDGLDKYAVQSQEESL